MYHIAISDLDGTLLAPTHKLSDTSKKGVIRWIESGKKFAIATGRHYIEAKNIQQEIGLPMAIISSNGARVHDAQGQLILKQNLHTDIATAICERYADSNVQVNLFTDQNWYANFRLKELDDVRLGEGFNCHERDLKTLDKSETIKMFFWGERSQLEIIHTQLKEQFGNRVNLTFSLNRCLEVMDASTNKGAAIAKLLKKEVCRVEHTIAFGDAMNDLEMLQYVGKPIVMANAQLALKKALIAAEATLSSREDGVVYKLIEILETENESM